MKKILLMMVGGTICTEKSEKGTLRINGNAGSVLLESLWDADSDYKKKAEFVLTPNLGILSENMTVEKWNLMLDTYREYMKKDAYDGVIFVHGTDTLAYSAALFSLALCDTKIPVFFVSSNARISLERANGRENLRYAVECILRGIVPNVYVVYKNISDGAMYLHLASRLRQCQAYSEDFESFGMLKMPAIHDEAFSAFLDALQGMYPKSGRKAFFESMGDWHLKNTVLKLEPYVGLDYSAISFDRYRAVLHGTYHSGTASADRDTETGAFSRYSVLHMLSLAKHADFYLSPAKKEGEIYDSVREIYENGEKIRFLYGLTNEIAYAKLLLAYSVFGTPEEIKAFVETECNFETSF